MPDNPPAQLLPVLETMKSYWRTAHDRGRQWLYRRPSMTYVGRMQVTRIRFRRPKLSAVTSLSRLLSAYGWVGHAG